MYNKYTILRMMMANDLSQEYKKVKENKDKKGKGKRITNCYQVCVFVRIFYLSLQIFDFFLVPRSEIYFLLLQRLLWATESSVLFDDWPFSWLLDASAFDAWEPVIGFCRGFSAAMISANEGRNLGSLRASNGQHTKSRMLYWPNRNECCSAFPLIPWTSWENR